MHKSYLRSGLVLLSSTLLPGLFLAGCGTAATATPTAAADTALPSAMPTAAPADTSAAPIPVRVAVLNFTSYGPFFIAQEEGFFAEEGLAVEFVKFDSGAQMIPSLEQGQIDAAATGPSIGFFNAIARNGDMKIVADKGNLDPAGCTYMALLAAPDWVSANPNPGADALRGRKISIDTSNFEAFMFETKVLAPLGLTLKDLTAESIPSPSLLDAAQNHSVDFVSIGDPWIVRLTDTGNMAVWKPYQELAPNMQFGILVYGKNFLVEKPDVGVKLMTAYLKAVRRYNEGKTDRNIEIMAQYTKLDPELLKRACWPPMQNDGSVNLTTVLDFQTWAVGKGLLEQGSTADAMWDPQFVDAANKALAD
jgi:ABC-type nitrate/sulfonate/bicarbonate transport system substrate-binding protein